MHRIGRTGRAGKSGKAIAIVSPGEKRKLLFIQRISNAKITKGKLPDANEMVRIKKARIADEIETIIATEQYGAYTGFARELLGDNEPEVVLSALLKHYVKDDLDPKAYKIIQENKTGGARDDRYSSKGVHLFFGKGRKDNMAPRKILDILKFDTGVDSRHINDIRIMELFSFFTTSPDNAEFILNAYQKKSKGRKPLVVRARERD